ncbi:MAG: hypothetical protein GC160_29005 [Acidobacteria bacterium]|nr:hypothetical protein [Acidobacteriota bacterium]
MATRGARISPDHVTALNSIEVEYYSNDSNSRKVVNAWRKYLDHLNGCPQTASDDIARSELLRWQDTSNELFIQLLYRLALSLDYDFEETLLKRGYYAPRGHGDLELDQLAIRRGMAQVLNGERSIPVLIDAHEPENADRLRALTIENLEGRRPIPIVVVSDNNAGES